jgi:ArsR family transcriptional regulator
MSEIHKGNENRAKILKAIADPVRLQIIEYLKEEEQCVCRIIPAVGKRQSTVSKHLNILYDSGILDRRIDSKWTYYRIKNPKIFILLKELDRIALDNASDLMDAVKKKNHR